MRRVLLLCCLCTVLIDWSKATLPNGYTDRASAMHTAWIGAGNLQGTVNGLAACQSKGAGHACVAPSEMGALTIVAGSVDTSTTPSVLVFTVEGTWTKNSVATDCEMQVKASFITCPHWDWTPEKCKQCTTGFGKFDLTTSLSSSSGSACAVWFARADAVVRGGLAAQRTNSIQYRAEGCEEASEGFNSGCTSWAGKKCFAQADRSFAHDGKDAAECKQLCLDDTTCKVAVSVGTTCIGCKVTPTTSHSGAVAFPVRLKCP